ncbi:uncharacterized protein EV422DRAFT_394171 [Fimicolochytrium jonesii]|uniref:uncharacterized protein n=1 Tax=Fimicolochytrium jonesii TaxID=1396493 RepID=UPI0022FE2827|nr:uncharacterized protein EV422DRAFT_394171 [Fimicolochytrium jonesii]KAI8823164.1 hypothetical protein EV422DRAFT_394171 [Fimicolochytrium jonesii]
MGFLSTTVRNNPQRVVLFAALGLSILSILAVALLTQLQDYTCWSETCAERGTYAYQNLVTIWTFYAWLVVTAVAVYFAQQRNWGAEIVFRLPFTSYQVTRMRLMVFTAVFTLQAGIFAYWWRAADQARLVAAIAALANPETAASAHHHRRHEHDEPAAAGTTGANIVIPFTFDIFCGNMFRASAHPVAIQLALALMPVSRRGILSSLLKIDYDTSLELHRWSGVFTIIFAFGHSMGHELPNYIKRGLVGQLKNRFKPAADYRGAVTLTGYVAAFTFLWVGINSIPKIRRANYSWFWINHTLAWGAIAMAFIHASPMLHLAMPAVLFYMVDAAVRVYNRTTPAHITSVTLEECGYIRVDIAGWDVPYAPGQWVSLKIPALSRVMWHPFTIASSYGSPSNASTPSVHYIHDEYNTTPNTPTSPGGVVEKSSFMKSREILVARDTITLIIKPTDRKNRWTSSLLALWESRRDDEGHAPIEVFIDGPHGKLPPRFLSSQHIVTIAGGSGIPGALSIANHVLEQNSVQSIDVVWTAREAGASRLSSYLELQRHKVLQQAGRHSCSLNVSSRDGRLDMLANVRDTIAKFADEDSVGIYVCGPGEMVDAVVDAANECRKRRGGRIVVHTEGYER